MLSHTQDFAMLRPTGDNWELLYSYTDNFVWSLLYYPWSFWNQSCWHCEHKHSKHFCTHIVTINADVIKLHLATLKYIKMLNNSLMPIREMRAPLRFCRVQIVRDERWHNEVRSDIIVAKSIGIGQIHSTKKYKIIWIRNIFTKRRILW